MKINCRVFSKKVAQAIELCIIMRFSSHSSFKCVKPFYKKRHITSCQDRHFQQKIARLAFLFGLFCEHVQNRNDQASAAKSLLRSFVMIKYARNRKT